MSNQTYNGLWDEAVAELQEQVQLEDPMLGAELEGGEKPPEGPANVSIDNAFQHFACLYIRYLQIFQKLDACYDNMVHPQKREDVLLVLEQVMQRVVELKHLLVKWSPPRADLQPPPPAQEMPFPWEYPNLDDILVDLKLPPETLEVPVPAYFTENDAATLRLRDKMISSYMKLKLQVDRIEVEQEEDLDGPPTDITLDEAIETIQRNERGRQGKSRAILMKSVIEEKKRNNAQSVQKVDIPEDVAASNIQKLFRGFSARVLAAKTRDEELIFIGMKPDSNGLGDDLERELAIAHSKRKTEQAENKEAYAKALVDLKGEVARDEGPQIRDKLRQERHLWVTDKIAETKDIPDDMAEFYADMYPDALAGLEPEEEEGGGKKGKKGKDDKGKKGKGDKGKKGKKKKEPKEEPPPEVPPPLLGPSPLTTAMYDRIVNYQGVWQPLDESYNFAQKHDVELAKMEIRVDVEKELRVTVDEMLKQNLAKIKAQLKAGGKKKGKGGKKKGKGGKKKKKGKGKGKALPGDKVKDIKAWDDDPDQYIAYMIEEEVVNNYRPRRIDELVGDFDYLGTIKQQMEKKDPNKKWLPPSPSAAQIRSALTEYCVLPMGSRNMKAKLGGKDPSINVKAVMLYGPSGVGKTMMVEAIANHLGAILVNLSPNRLHGRFPGKQGPDKILQCIYKVGSEQPPHNKSGTPIWGATNPQAPMVVYMDNCEEFFLAGGKKAKPPKDGPTRFAKSLQLYKNNGFQPSDRVIFIGCSSHPEKADKKGLKNFFDKFIYMPFPDYPSRLMLWKSFVAKQIEPRSAPGSLDLSTLARISEGFSGGMLSLLVANTFVVSAKFYLLFVYIFPSISASLIQVPSSGA